MSLLEFLLLLLPAPQIFAPPPQQALGIDRSNSRYFDIQVTTLHFDTRKNVLSLVDTYPRLTVGDEDILWRIPFLASHGTCGITHVGNEVGALICAALRVGV